MAPEVLSGEDYNPQKADVYSFGCVMYFIATGEETFQGWALHSFSISNNLDLIEIPVLYSEAYKTIMLLCL